MSNQNETGLGTNLSLDEAIAKAEQAKAEAGKDSVFVKIQDGETLKLPLSGKVFTRQASGTQDGKQWASTKIDFELDVKTPEGISKLWSLGISNPVVIEVLQMLKKGQKTVSVHRQGLGSVTKYAVIKERSL